MRVRDEQGHIVKLLHFRYNLRNLALLQELQRQHDTQNMPIVVERSTVRESIQLFRLQLDSSEVRMLNPVETSQVRRKVG